MTDTILILAMGKCLTVVYNTALPLKVHTSMITVWTPVKRPVKLRENHYRPPMGVTGGSFFGSSPEWWKAGMFNISMRTRTFLLGLITMSFHCQMVGIGQHLQTHITGQYLPLATTMVTIATMITTTGSMVVSPRTMTLWTAASFLVQTRATYQMEAFLMEVDWTEVRFQMEAYWIAATCPMVGY